MIFGSWCSKIGFVVCMKIHQICGWIKWFVLITSVTSDIKKNMKVCMYIVMAGENLCFFNKIRHGVFLQWGEKVSGNLRCNMKRLCFHISKHFLAIIVFVMRSGILVVWTRSHKARKREWNEINCFYNEKS